MTEEADKKAFLARLAQAMGRRTQLEIADKADIPRASINKYVNGEANPPWYVLVKLARALGVSVEWLATGEGPGPGEGTAEGQALYKTADQAAAEADTYAFVPRYDAQAGAGAGVAVIAEEQKGIFAFRKEWLVARGLAPEKLAIVHASGDSMEPDIRSGDVMLVDLRHGCEVGRDGIYVLRLGDDLLVKRLQFLPKGRVTAMSANPAYQPFDLPTDDGVAIVGRVVWIGKEV